MGNYDTTKKCTNCDWQNTYDSNDDWRHVGELKKCPKCGAELKVIPYKPIT